MMPSSSLGCYHHELGVQTSTLSPLPQALGTICNLPFPKLINAVPLAVAIAAQIG